MKKFSLVILILMLSVGIIACSKDNTTTNKKDNKETIADDSKKLIGGEEVGEGNIYLVNASGDTKDNSTLYIMYEDDAVLNQIGYECENMNDSVPTIIYINGTEIDKKQLGTGSGSITLEKEQLQKGIYNVEFIQKDGDETVFYHLEQYEVK